MPSSVLRCMLLCALVHGAVYACTLKNYTLWIERQDCAQCVVVNTTICSGYCYTQDTNLKGRYGRSYLIQRSCVPLSLVYRAVHVPGCPQGVNPQLYYPGACSCSCRHCDTRTYHCARTRPTSQDQCPETFGGVMNQTQPTVGT